MDSLNCEMNHKSPQSNKNTFSEQGFSGGMLEVSMGYKNMFPIFKSVFLRSELRGRVSFFK
jgi:hypothetical protein